MRIVTAQMARKMSKKARERRIEHTNIIGYVYKMIAGTAAEGGYRARIEMTNIDIGSMPLQLAVWQLESVGFTAFAVQKCHEKIILIISWDDVQQVMEVGSE